MLLLVFALGGAVFALAVWSILRRLADTPSGDDTATSLLDGACATAILAFATWIATSWALALPHWLSRPTLVAAGLLELVIGGFILVRAGALRSREIGTFDRVTAAVSLIALSPVVLWIAFVAWRGTVLPVYNHDALAYHLPKAVLLIGGHGFHAPDVPEARIATWPWNYELLLADTMILTGGDHATAALSTLAYFLFVLFAARIASSWWGWGAHAPVAASIAAATPIAVLHSGLHKNDLLMAVFALASLVWSARWLARGCRASAVLAVVALLLAIGTKVSGFFVVAAVAPILLFGLFGRRAQRPRLSGRELMVAAGGSVALALALGGWPYVDNLLRIHRLASPPQMTGGAGYGDGSNIWTYTVLAFLRPFEGEGGVWNPFRGETWWWLSNDVWMSHFGALISVLAAGLVPCVLLFRKRGSRMARLERAAASLGALALYVITLPTQMRPVGFFATFGRYVLFIVPVVVAWTVSPLLVAVAQRAGAMRAPVLLAAAAGSFAWAVYIMLAFGVHDAYAPIEWVAHMLNHPEDRVPFVRQNRAASVFDAVADSKQICAIDVGYDTWIYPAYGADWTRKVEFLRPAAGEIAIPDDAGWVIVDRSWNVFFGNPGFVDMGQARNFLGRGEPTREDLKVYRQLRRDPRFVLVYDDRSQNQALFRRKP
ncbi:MAG TPA: hypothetical protein VK841_01765 [Polyangiaceae bacterium]|nr:hypothetical protein [Polyangiaceae bacterium]